MKYTWELETDIANLCHEVTPVLKYLITSNNFKYARVGFYYYINSHELKVGLIG